MYEPDGACLNEVYIIHFVTALLHSTVASLRSNEEPHVRTLQTVVLSFHHTYSLFHKEDLNVSFTHNFKFLRLSCSIEEFFYIGVGLASGHMHTFQILIFHEELQYRNVLSI